MAGIIFNIQESLNNSAFNILQEPVQMILTNEVEAFERDSIIPKVFVMKTTDKYREEFRSTTAMDGFKPTEDMEVAGISDFQESYNKQFVFQTWTNSFVVSKQTMEDNQLMNINAEAMGFIKGYGRTREQYAVNLLGAALGLPGATDAEKTALLKNFRITAKSGTGMDTVDGELDGTKQQYFHNKHKGVKINGKSLVEQSNRFYAELDLADGNQGALEEKVMDVIEQVASKGKTYMDDKGNIVPVDFTRIVIAEDYRLKNLLERGLKSKYGSPMGGNGTNLFYGKYELVVSPYLASVPGFKGNDHGLILISPDRNNEGLGATWFDRVPLTVRSYIDQKTEANIWAGRARFGAGFGDWRAMAYIDFIPEEDGRTEVTGVSDKIIPVVTGVSLSKTV